MHSARVNIEVCIKLSETLMNMKDAVLSQRYDFTNPTFFPSLSDSIQKIANYFGAMIAIMHRFWELREGKFRHSEAIIQGKRVTVTAEYIWKHCRDKYEEDFFCPDKLSRISWKEFTSCLGDDRGKVPLPDSKERLLLLKNFGKVLAQRFKGDLNFLHRRSKGYYSRAGNGFLDLMNGFEAYSDKYHKKTFLLCKVMTRRGHWVFYDKENANVPIDYHVMRLLLRSGCVEVEDDLAVKLASFSIVTSSEEEAIRSATYEACRLISRESGIHPYDLDDWMWSSRSWCPTKNEPKCSACLIREVCKKRKHLQQPLYPTNFY